MTNRNDDIDLSDIPEITDFSGYIRNPFAGKVQKDGKYTVTINMTDGTKERYHIDAKTLERTRIDEIAGVEVT